MTCRPGERNVPQLYMEAILLPDPFPHACQLQWSGKEAKTRSEWRRWLLAKQLLSDLSSGDCYIGIFEGKTLRLLNVDTHKPHTYGEWNHTQHICDVLFIFTNIWIAACNTILTRWNICGLGQTFQSRESLQVFVWNEAVFAMTKKITV